MNKYQEALDLKFEKTYIIDLHLEKFPEAQEDLYKNEEFKENINKIEEFSNKYKQATADALQELVDLRKPKKLHYEYDGYADGYPVYDMAYCPNCGRFFEVDGEHFKNCPDCTQALDWTMEVVIGVDWSEEDEN